MSDILIKNMKMPENCLHCGFSHMASDCLKIWIICKIKDISVTDEDAVKVGRPDWCPLIEVPTPHGRLGDLDRLEQMFVDIDNAPYSAFDGEEPFYTAEDAAQIIRLAPTIIESEEMNG